MDTKEIKFIVSNISPFNKLKEKEINAFISLCEVKEYKNREIIYNESDPPDYFYLLLRGRIVAITKFEGKESEIELLKRGTCFGMISIFTGETHSVTAKSIETSFVLRVEKDKFKDFLNKHPVFFSEFFRLFSQRVKRRSHPKKIFQCKKIAVSGSASSGKTTYMFNLATQMQEQTRKRVIALELSSQEDFVLPFLEKAKNAGTVVSSKVLNLKEFTEETVSQYIVKGKIDYLLVRTEAGADFGALLNFLSENYHFIIYEIPYGFWKGRLDEFVYPVDLLHFITCVERGKLKTLGDIIRRLRNTPANGEKIKVLLSEFGKRNIFLMKRKKSY
ncbi:MAG: Crp/Fnr family transcriptional regulator [Candidatus Omnitrophota bacterium]|nr:MAG: Crp/Fnr family transcriptional regulator [Candidatus Omnitrophota bacterium]